MAKLIRGKETKTIFEGNDVREKTSYTKESRGEVKKGNDTGEKVTAEGDNLITLDRGRGGRGEGR